MRFSSSPNQNSESYQINTLLSPTSHQVDAKKSLKTLLRLASLQRNDEQRETCSLLLLHRRKLTDFKAFGAHPVVELDHRHTSTEVAKGKSHSNYTKRFFQTCSKAEKHHLLFNFQVGFFVDFQAGFLLVFFLKHDL